MTDPVYLTVAVGRWPEDGFEIIGAYTDEAEAEAVAEEIRLDEDSGWHHAYAKQMDVTGGDATAAEVSQSVEETAIVEDGEDLQRWFDETRLAFESERGYPESVTVSITWNRDDTEEER